jgi:Fe-S cluster assembly protein SufD
MTTMVFSLFNTTTTTATNAPSKHITMRRRRLRGEALDETARAALGLLGAPRRLRRRSRDHRASVSVVVSATTTKKKTRDNEWIGTACSAARQHQRDYYDDNEKTVERMRRSAKEALSRSKTPTNRDESWRFFDVAEITSATLIRDDDEEEVKIAEEDMKELLADAPSGAKVVAFVNGRFSEKWSSIGGGDEDADVSISRRINGDIANAIGTYDEDEEVDAQGAIFSRINKNSTAGDNVVCVTVKTRNAENIVYIVHARKSSKDRKDGELASGANARVFIDAMSKSSLNVIEKYATVGGSKSSAKKYESRYWANDVVEMRLAEDARVFHSLSQNHGREAVHTRATYVRQNESSAYEINEVNVGAKLHRHDLRVKQLGKQTDTKLNCFNLAGAKQTQDLHSSIVLDFEEGTTDQRHRCIVSSSSGKGVFDGNVRVNKFAQRTDAKQITRNLLLVPKATVNTRPNLQIVADDVKCTHGCTVSDLEEEELFYIQSRGLTKEVARSLLVSGFGTEIISGIQGGEKFKEYVRASVQKALSKDAVEELLIA